MINDDVFQCLYETPPDLSLILPSNALHPLEQVLPNVVNIDPLIGGLTDPVFILLLLGELGCVVCYIHEHCDGSKVRVDVLVVGLREALDAVKDVYEVLLT